MAKKIGFAAMPKVASIGGAQGKAKSSVRAVKKDAEQGKAPKLKLKSINPPKAF